jgi:hypothetical protein
MNSEAEIASCLEEIRQAVCQRCSDRPTGGPPCGPLGKRCAVELDLPLILQAIRDTDSPCMACPVENIRQHLCTCGQPGCSCPRDYVLMRVVQAVRAIDESRRTSELGPVPRQSRCWPEPANPFSGKESVHE